MTAAERVLRLDATILDLRVALLNPAVCGERRVLLQGELIVLRCARLGISCRGQRSYLRRAGLARPGVMRRARD